MSLDLDKFLEKETYPPQKVVMKGGGSFKAIFKITNQEKMEGYLAKIGVLTGSDEDEDEKNRKSKLMLRSIMDEVLVKLDDIVISPKMMDSITEDFSDEVKEDAKTLAEAKDNAVKKLILDKNIAVTHACWKSFQAVAMNDSN